MEIKISNKEKKGKRQEVKNGKKEISKSMKKIKAKMASKRNLEETIIRKDLPIRKASKNRIKAAALITRDKRNDD